MKQLIVLLSILYLTGCATLKEKVGDWVGYKPLPVNIYQEYLTRDCQRLPKITGTQGKDLLKALEDDAFYYEECRLLNNKKSESIKEIQNALKGK